MYFTNDNVFKLYEKDHVKNYQDQQFRVLNEYAITKLARDEDIENIIHL